MVREYNEGLLALLALDLLFFAVTLFPPAFSWSNRDGNDGLDDGAT